MWPWATVTELVELLMRIYAEENPGFTADAVYCYGQEKDNIPSVVSRAVKLLRDGKVNHIAQSTFGGLEKYKWEYELIRAKLLEEGVPEKAIVPIPHPTEFNIAHTHTEAIGLARYAKEAGWQLIYVTALPSHALRAYTETVTAIIREYPQLLAYSVVGAVLPWTENATHSQGVVSGRRHEVIGKADNSEIKKIIRYYLKGDLVSAREVLDYLNLRTDMLRELDKRQDEFFMCLTERRRPLIIGENNEVIGFG